MQKAKGSNPLSMYTTNEHDILEERNHVIDAIAQLVPNHEERIQSIQVTEAHGYNCITFTHIELIMLQV